MFDARHRLDTIHPVPISFFMKTGDQLMIRSVLLSILILILLPSKGPAQDDLVTEKQLQAEAEYIRANKLKLTGKLEEALKIFEDLARKDKKNHAANYEAARIYESMQQWDRAEKAIRDALRVERNEPWYHVKLADILEAQFKFSDAADVFAALIDLRPDQPAFYARWADLLTRAGKWEEAIRVIDLEEAALGKNLERTLEKVKILEAHDQKARVVEEWRKLHQTFPDKATYLRYQVDALVKYGLTDTLDRLYTRILAIDPDDSGTQMKLAKFQLATGSAAEQVKALAPMIERPDIPLDEKIKILIPYLEKIAGKKDSMLSVVLLEQSEKLVRQYPQNAGPYALQADILNQTGRLREAAESYARTIELNNTQPLVWEQYLFALAETHQYSNLLSASEEAMDLFPNISVHFLLHGTALMAEGKWDEAMDVTDQSLLMAGKNKYIRMEAALQLARCFHMKMDPGQRNAMIQQVFAMDETALPAMRLYLGYGLLEGQRTEQWQDILKKARQLYPEDGSLIVFEKLDQTSVSPEKLGRTDFDERVLKDGVALEWIGSWVASKGKKEWAISWWESAVLQSDFHPETLYLIEQAKS